MATHKVPQDVEADDKLIGFLSLKQFIFTVLGIGFGYLTFFFFTKVHPAAAVIWLPPTIVLLALGLYQRKDQPVEVFFASALKFYLQPRKRKWNQEGYEERVKITAPPKIDKHYTKDFTGEEASSRLTTLSRMMDSRGWASKLAHDWQNPQLATAAVSDRLIQPNDAAAYSVTPQDAASYVQPADVMDEETSVVARQMQFKVEQAEVAAKQQAVQSLQAAREASSEADEPLPTPHFASYPTMHQKVVKPQEPPKPIETPIIATPQTQPKEQVSPEPISPTPPPKPPVVQPKVHEDEDGVEISLH